MRTGYRLDINGRSYYYDTKQSAIGDYNDFVKDENADVTVWRLKEKWDAEERDYVLTAEDIVLTNRPLTFD